jgi:uncharacterized membrane protein YjjP (DUF1212 family)
MDIIKSLPKGPYGQRKRILLKWVPNVFRAGGTPSVANRHIVRLSSLLGLSVLPTFLPGRVQLFIQDNSCQDTAATTGDASTQRRLDDEEPRRKDFEMLSVSWSFDMPLLEQMEHDLEAIREGSMSKMTLDRLEDMVDGYCAQTPLYDNWMIVLAYGILSGTMAFAFFGGTWADGLMTFLLGALAGLFVVLCDYKPFSFNILHELISSFIISLFSMLAAYATNGAIFHYWPMVLAGTIWILPGFSMVIGFTEVVRKFHLPGFIQHAAAVFVALIMAVGFTLSCMLLKDVVGLPAHLIQWPPAVNSPIRLPMRFVMCALFAASCSIIYRSPPRHMLLSMPAALFSFALVVLGDVGGYPDELVAFPFAALTTLFCRMIAGLTAQTHLAALYVAILPLVPGSRIVRSAFKLMSSVHGYDLKGPFPDFSSSIFISLAVAFGVFLADTLYAAYLRPYIIRPFRRYLATRQAKQDTLV